MNLLTLQYTSFSNLTFFEHPRHVCCNKHKWYLDDLESWRAYTRVIPTKSCEIDGTALENVLYAQFHKSHGIWQCILVHCIQRSIPPSCDSRCISMVSWSAQNGNIHRSSVVRQFWIYWSYHDHQDPRRKLQRFQGDNEDAYPQGSTMHKRHEPTDTVENEKRREYTTINSSFHGSTFLGA